ncbi:hypothetical protein [Archangium violaceum]|uniref:hypothetical protein n=1 Tax=Archangium violaceum TaxID=83451 RepID=UPI00190F83C9|nr:hypothetical protein [Archangium violaceum]
MWIGGGSIICPGVTIDEGSTIGAGSVVVKDIPPYVFAAGTPARSSGPCAEPPLLSGRADPWAHSGASRSAAAQGWPP